MNAVVFWLALAAVCRPGLALQVDAAPPRQLPLDPPARFSVTYLHSMYLVPFTEDYVIEPDGMIRLDAVRSAGGTVSDYFALEGTDGEVRTLERRFASLSFLVGATHPQTLVAGARRVSFGELGGAGTRVVLSASGCEAPSSGSR